MQQLRGFNWDIFDTVKTLAVAWEMAHTSSINSVSM